MLRGEEERKKTQEERDVDSLIRQYYEQKALKGVSIEFFLNRQRKNVLKNINLFQKTNSMSR